MAGRVGMKLSKLFTNSLNVSVRVSQRGIGHHTSVVSATFARRQKKYFENMDKKEYIELTKRSNFVEWNYSAEVFAFSKRLHEDIPSELLVEAFTQKSYIYKEELKQKEVGIVNPNLNLVDNSNLAADGQKVMENYIPNYLSYFYPRFPLEGLNSITACLLSDEILANVGKNIGTEFLILSADYPIDNATYSQTFKAIVGAINKSQGLERSRLFVRDFVITQLAGKDINDFLVISNPLEVLSDILKRDGREPPEPRIICQSAKKTILANYHVGIYSSKQLLGHCSGESIEVAVEMAAFECLKKFFQTTDSCKPISYDVNEIPENITNPSLSNWSLKMFEKQSASSQK